MTGRCGGCRAKLRSDDVNIVSMRVQCDGARAALCFQRLSNPEFIRRNFVNNCRGPITARPKGKIREGIEYRRVDSVPNRQGCDDVPISRIHDDYLLVTTPDKEAIL